MPDEPASDLRIDDLARDCGLTVDTIRFYQREGLLPAAERVGRTRVYGAVHRERLEQIRDLQQRRFSLAAIKALLDAERPGIVEGIFAGGDTHYSFDELVERAEIDPALADRLRWSGLLRDPAEFGRDAYDAADLDLLRSVADMARLGLPGDVIVELASIYTEGVERMQSQVLDLFTGRRGPGWTDADELRAFQTNAAASAGELLPTVTRMVQYVHQRTLQRLTLGAIETEVDGRGTAPDTDD
ncbi:MAG: MerR family transcriptional regulator [Acidimicrobiia bacterium]